MIVAKTIYLELTDDDHDNHLSMTQINQTLSLLLNAIPGFDFDTMWTEGRDG